MLHQMGKANELPTQLDDPVDAFNGRVCGGTSWL
jgi:hypothetical protein